MTVEMLFLNTYHMEETYGRRAIIVAAMTVIAPIASHIYYTARQKRNLIWLPILIEKQSPTYDPRLLGMVIINYKVQQKPTESTL